MALETVDFHISPEDGWVQVASLPTFCLIKPSHTWSYHVAIASGSPDLAARGSWRSDGKPFEFQPAAADGDVYVKVDRKPTDRPLHFGVIRTAVTVTEVVDELDALGLVAAHWSADEGITIATGVSSWVDRINAYNLAQATGANQPAFSAAGFNGRACLVGDGVNDMLSGGSMTLLPQGSDPCEIWCLFGSEVVSAAAQRMIFSYGGSGNDRRDVVIQTTNNVQLELPSAAGNVQAQAGAWVIGNHFFRGYFTSNDARAALDTSVLGTSVDPNTNTANTFARVFTLTSGSREFAGRIRHVIVTIGTLTTLQAQRLAQAMQYERSGN